MPNERDFFFDNPDLQFRLEQLDLREALEFKEKGYSESDLYPARRATTRREGQLPHRPRGSG